MYVVYHGGYRKKFTQFDENMGLCIEADTETYPVISESVRANGQCGITSEEREIAENELLVPYSEFRELVFWIPDFDDLPMLMNARKLAGNPTKFIVKCFDGPDHQVGDMLLIDTQGYDYARYKATVDRVEDFDGTPLV